VLSSFGYHPLPQDSSEFCELVPVSQILVLGPEVPDISGTEVRFVSNPEVSLQRGLYWFGQDLTTQLLVVTEGENPSDGEITRDRQDPDHALFNAKGWHDSLWQSAQVVERPLFTVNDEVIVTATGQDSIIRGRRFTSGTWLYEIRLDGKRQWLPESGIEAFPEDDDPSLWAREEPADTTRFAATLTRAKLEGTFTDTVFSFRATRTLFRPYQFKPVIKLLQTGKSRLLIADEVGLGKTIEAGLIWTELEARQSADRVLIIAPSNLVPKWRREMEERFNFNLEELSGQAIQDFEERVREGRLPRRGAYIGSLEKLRRWDGLQELAGLIQFDLVIVDEAHYLRNESTKGYALGSLISELTDNMVFLTATPVNLRNRDLFNLLELLSPGDFPDEYALDEQLEPNLVLHQLGTHLTDKNVTSEDRLSTLDELGDYRYGKPLLDRPEVGFLREIFASDSLSPADIVRTRRYLADLNALSSAITRTRKLEVDDRKSLREPWTEQIKWTPAESHFYDEFYAWCARRAEVAGTAVQFSMQMPLRLASACLPAARSSVLEWASAAQIVDEDAPGNSASASSQVPPHSELLAAAAGLDRTDSKLERLKFIIRELIDQNRQTLLFTFSRPALQYLRSELEGMARVAVMHGGVTKDDRRRIMADFRSGKYDIVLANRVASEGLDFEFCSAVINYDLPWNPMEIEQRIGRIDRIGQAEDKMLIVNFYNDQTIDERILIRVLERIGIFERSIGALEPIIMDRLADLEKTMLDFKLSPRQREEKANQVLEALEAQNVGVEDLTSASSFLLASDDVDVSGMEEDLLKKGRYVGHAELVHLVQDWCKTSGAAGVRLSADDRFMTVRGNSVMATQLQAIVARGQRTNAEVQETISALQNEIEINVVLDQELARTSGGTLLSTNHPLVRGALSVPGFRRTRFAAISLTAAQAQAPEGRFIVQLAEAEWGGVRPGREVWGTVVDQFGNEAPSEVSDAVLSNLASGGLNPGISRLDPQTRSELTQRTSELISRRQVREGEAKQSEAASLVVARRTSWEIQHERKLASVEAKISTALERGSSKAVPLFRAQLRAAEDRYQKLLSTLNEKDSAALSVTPLAVCEVEIRDV
jgi:superfamily II DNA or RNA helicase